MLLFFFFYLFVHYIINTIKYNLMTANLDIMAGDLSKFNELFYEDPLIQA